MGEVDGIVAILAEDNPKAPAGDLLMYATAYREWRHAAANIAEHGTIVSHPRTGAPIENPYLKVRAGAMATMGKLTRVRSTDRLWRE
jgi:phage terminase small subunit